MWKMIGPHQGLRLERMRTEIERDKFVGVAKEDPFASVEQGPPDAGDGGNPPDDDGAMADKGPPGAS